MSHWALLLVGWIRGAGGAGAIVYWGGLGE